MTTSDEFMELTKTGRASWLLDAVLCQYDATGSIDDALHSMVREFLRQSPVSTPRREG